MSPRPAVAPDPAFADLQQQMAAETAPQFAVTDQDLALRDSPAEAIGPNPDDAADLELGRLFREMADTAHGEGTGRRFRDALVLPTKPGTPARVRQDKAWQLMAARIGKLAGVE